jgi:hypothetical protein
LERTTDFKLEQPLQETLRIFQIAAAIFVGYAFHPFVTLGSAWSFSRYRKIDLLGLIALSLGQGANRLPVYATMR